MTTEKTALCDARCKRCFYADITANGKPICLYILFRQGRRSCPAGAGCNKYRPLAISRSLRAALVQSDEFALLARLQADAEMRGGKARV